MSSVVSLYNGKGAGPFCTAAAEKAILQHMDPKVHLLQIVTGFTPDKPSIKAIVVPGGNAFGMWYEADLCTSMGQGNFNYQLHRQYVGYYGICAGAILASTAIVDKASQTTPFLGLVPNQCMLKNSKPAAEPISIKHVRVGIMKLPDPLKIPCVEILNPGFLPHEDTKGLSEYSDSTLIETIHRPGTETKPPLVLSGAHWEMNSKTVASEMFKQTFRATPDQIQSLVDALAPSDDARSAVFRKNLERCGISCMPLP